MKSSLVLMGASVLCMAMAGCASILRGPEIVPTANMPGLLEPIHGAAFTRDIAAFRVTSNGCTEKDDVKPFITKLRSRTVITLRRLDEDHCKNTRAEGVLLKWTFEELGLEPGSVLEVNNPYILPQRIQVSNPTWSEPDDPSGTK